MQVEVSFVSDTKLLRSIVAWLLSGSVVIQYFIARESKGLVLLKLSLNHKICYKIDILNTVFKLHTSVCGSINPLRAQLLHSSHHFMFQMKLQSTGMRRIILFLCVYITAFNLRVTAQENNKICMQPKDVGESTDPSLRNIEWYYNGKDKRCDAFFYNGAGGNSNRFSNETDCLKTCSSTYNELFPDGSAACDLPKVRGDCQAMILRWYYDKESEKCDTFFFSGCHGNGNRFENKKSCWNLCVASKQGRRILDEEIEVQARDEGDTVAIVFGCLFGIAVIGFIVAFVIQRKKYKRHTKKSRSTEVEMK